MKTPYWMKDVEVDTYHGVMTYRIAWWYLPILYAKALWREYRGRRRMGIEP